MTDQITQLCIGDLANLASLLYCAGLISIHHRLGVTLYFVEVCKKISEEEEKLQFAKLCKMTAK